MAKKQSALQGTIALNRKARFDYQLHERFEAGLALTGWEVKALRAGKAQLTDTYVLLKDGEAFLLGSNITPLNTASTHVNADPKRTRKLLLHRKEIATVNRGNTTKRTDLHSHGTILERQQGKVRDCSGHGQERARQKGHDQGKGVETGQATSDERL